MNFYEVTVRKIAVTFYYGAVALANIFAGRQPCFMPK